MALGKKIYKFNHGDKQLVAFIFFVIIIQHMEGRKERTNKPQKKRKKQRKILKKKTGKLLLDASFILCLSKLTGSIIRKT